MGWLEKWSDCDDKLLRASWRDMSVPHIAESFGRTQRAIFARAHRLGLLDTIDDIPAAQRDQRNA